MSIINNERRMVLSMVNEGKVSAEEGSRLLTSIGEPKPKPSPEVSTSVGGARWFRVRVSDIYTGKTKATVNIPLGLMSWGMNIGAQFAPEVSGINLDEMFEMLQSGFQGKLVDVLDEEGGDHVEIFVE